LIRKKKLFDEHLNIETVKEQIEKGELKQGIMRINPYNRSEGYITIAGYDHDVFIDGRDQNRAMEGDLVAIEIYPKEQWIALKKKKRGKRRGRRLK